MDEINETNVIELGMNRPKGKKKRKKKHYLLKFAIFITICIGVYFLLSSSIFTINEISVANSSYYQADEIINMANVKTGVNIFWGIDKSDMIKRLEKNSYIKGVKIIRKFPNKLIIDIDERIQVAAIVYGQEYVVIDGDGIVLRKTDVEPRITLLKGLTISKLNVGNPLDAEENIALKNILKMLEAMEKGDIYFKKIVINKIIIRAYIYDNLICKGTPKQLLYSINSGNLQKVINKLFEDDITRGTMTFSGNNYISFSPLVD